MLKEDTQSHDAKRRCRAASMFSFNEQMTLFCLNVLESQMRARGDTRLCDALKGLRGFIASLRTHFIPRCLGMQPGLAYSRSQCRSCCAVQGHALVRPSCVACLVPCSQGPRARRRIRFQWKARYGSGNAVWHPYPFVSLLLTASSLFAYNK